jgi:hypothetical protein
LAIAQATRREEDFSVVIHTMQELAGLAPPATKGA